MARLTAIWQRRSELRENDWLDELFGEYIDKHIVDGTRSVVMDNCLLIDSLIHTRNESYYKSFSERKNAYLLHLSDEHYHGGYQTYKYFKGVFRNYWSPIFESRAIQVVPLGYSNGLSQSGGFKPASSRSHLWSFVGETARGSRPEMVTELRHMGPHFLRATDVPEAVPLSPREYQTVLRESVFAPSPMGRLNIECFRLYEALECSAIPIVERRMFLDYYRHLFGAQHPLISVKNWHEAAVIMRDLQRNPNELDRLQESIREWWKTYKIELKCNIGKFLRRTESYVSNNRQLGAGLGWAYRIPLWQPIELSRHHSFRALVRRAHVEIGSLIARS